MAEAKFKVGDTVFSEFFGEGIVTGIDTNELFIYPIHVEWTKKKQTDQGRSDIFTLEGLYSVNPHDPDMDISLGKEKQKDPEFKIGEWVFYPYRGMGIVISNFNDGRPFPVAVQWLHVSGDPADYPVSTFTKEGVPEVPLTTDENVVLEHVKQKSMHDDEENESEEEENMGMIHSVINHKLAEDDDERTVERMEDALQKRTEDAINPSHYKVEGLPESIDIINHLMHREQYEGFLWGNILKYAYRYGRKGDKGETAGKIAWYADQLKAVEDWRKENET